MSESSDLRHLDISIINRSYQAQGNICNLGIILGRIRLILKLYAYLHFIVCRFELGSAKEAAVIK